MTTAAPIRFRCFRCQKLLGVSRSKAGAVVNCPQCSVELIVPELTEAAEAVEPQVPDPAAPTPRPSPSASRVQPAVVPWDAPPEPEPPSEHEAEFPAIQVEPLTLRPDPPARTRGSYRPRAEPLAPAEAPIRTPAMVAEEPAIREPAPALAIAPPRPALREPGARRDDVVLPRAAAVLWSFAVLMALILAFAAGLLAGRFLWAPRAVPGLEPRDRPAPRAIALFPGGDGSEGARRQTDCIPAGGEV